MAPPPRLEEQDPHPETLVRFLLEQGDPESALEVCRGWRLREPTNESIDALEAEAAEVPAAEAPTLSFDVTTAEKYLQKGFLHEAAFLYEKVVSAPDFDADAEVRERYEKLSEFVHSQLPEDAPPQAREAEEQVRLRQLPMALLVYHELAQSQPENRLVNKRRDLLRSLLVDMPSTVRAEEIASLSNTITDSTEVSASVAPKKRRRRLPARTWKSATPPEECLTAEEPAAEKPGRRRQVRTQVDLPLQACFEAIEAAKASETPPAEVDEQGGKDSTLPSPTAPTARQIPVLEPLMTPKDGAPEPVENEPLEVVAEPPSIDEPPPVMPEPVAEPPSIELPPPVVPEPVAEPPSIELPPPVVPEPVATAGPIDGEEPSFIIEDEPRKADMPPIVDAGSEEPIPKVFDDPPEFPSEKPLPSVHESSRADDPSLASQLEPALIDNGPPAQPDQAPSERDPASSGERDQDDSDRDSWHEPAPVEPSHTSWLEPLIDDPPGRDREPEEALKDSWRTSSSAVAVDKDVDPFDQDWTSDIERKPKRRRRGPRTLPSVSPMVVPQDETGRSVVEVPREVPSVMERVSSRMSAREAAALAEPLGVLVREIFVIE